MSRFVAELGLPYAVADPLFEDLGNFTLKPESPAFALGIQPLDLQGVPEDSSPTA